MKEEEYLEMPWSIEDTIENLGILKKELQKKVIDANIDRKGKQDAEEVAFDFDRAIEALERNRTKKVLEVKGDKLKFGTCPCCERRISNVEGGNYCQNCGQRLEWEE